MTKLLADNKYLEYAKENNSKNKQEIKQRHW